METNIKGSGAGNTCSASNQNDIKEITAGDLESRSVAMIPKPTHLFQDSKLPNIPTTSEGYFALVEGFRGIGGTLNLHGMVVETLLLTEGCLHRTRSEQRIFAERLGYTLAARDENLAYATLLSVKEERGSPNDAERAALQSYRTIRVRDTAGALYLDGSRLRSNSNCVSLSNAGASPTDGALLVRRFPENR